MFRRFSVCATLLVVAGVCVGHLWADDAAKAPQTPPKTAQAWTLDEALEQLRINPDNAYLQYVALQLGQNEHRAEEAAKADRDCSHDQRQRPGRREERRVDLFDLFTGATAVQESLQLDTMLGTAMPTRTNWPRPPQNTVRVADLAGPKVKSHPWGKMLAAAELGGKKPEIGPLDLCVPEDQYYIDFRSLTKLLDAVDAGDVWGSHLFNQAAQSAKTQRSQRSAEDATGHPDRSAHAAVLRHGRRRGGRHRQRPVLPRGERRDDALPGEAARGASAADGRLPGGGREVAAGRRAEHGPDRRRWITCRCVRRIGRSTSSRRIRGPTCTCGATRRPPWSGCWPRWPARREFARLGDSAEFNYIRTLMPRGDKEEDGLIYLSDPFIRRLVGPELKLTERRRLICYNHLRMIGHAAMLYRTQFGKQPGSLEELVASGCAPAFAEDRSGKVVRPAAACPCGGKYSLARRRRNRRLLAPRQRPGTGPLPRDRAGERDPLRGRGVPAVRRRVQPLLAAVLRSDRHPRPGHAASSTARRRSFSR